MILANKISNLRKKNGWSQEELSDKMNVSRQAVSKWESAQTTPDLDKILLLGNFFGVTTDYLLKDEIEDEDFTDEISKTVKRITLTEANEFLELSKSTALRIAFGTFLCVISIIPLLLLIAGVETSVFHLSEGLAIGIGLGALFIIISIAVAIFIFSGLKSDDYDFIDKESFETEYGVTGMVKEKKKAYRSSYVRRNIIATCFCILSPIPLLSVAFTEKEFLIIAMLTVTLLLSGIGASLFVDTVMRWESFQKLLQEGEFSPQEKRKKTIKDRVSLFYWMMALAIYLGWSFFTDSWSISWIVWPIAGILFSGFMSLLILAIDKGDD